MRTINMAPTRRSVQVLRLAFDHNMPVHVEQFGCAPVGWCLPSGHRSQASVSRNDPFATPNFPAVHEVQLVDAEWAAYFAAGHGSQASVSRNDPFTTPNFPGVHEVQLLDPGYTWNFPAGHALHVAPVAVWNWPAGQSLQSSALSFEVSLDHARRNLPLGHAAQDSAAGPEYLPPGQPVQAGAPAASLYLPAGQPAQTPPEDKYLPAEHMVRNRE